VKRRGGGDRPIRVNEEIRTKNEEVAEASAALIALVE
jgi:hypothetical protein